MQQCPNGHEVEGQASFCQSCGAMTTPVAVPTSASTSKKSNTPKIIGGIAAIFAVLVIVLIAIRPHHPARASILFTTQVYGSRCSTTQSDHSIAEGTLIKVTGDNGQQVGSGVFGPGVDSITAGGRYLCTYKASVSVPANQNVYTEDDGGSNTLSEERSKLVSNDCAWYFFYGSSTSSGYSSGYSSSSGY